MADIPDHANMWVHLRPFVDVPGDESELPVPTADGHILVGYNPVTNRLKIFEASGDKREIPSAAMADLSTGTKGLVNDAVLLVDENGNLSTTTIDGLVANPVIALGSLPLPVSWPDYTQGGGRGWVLTNDHNIDATTPSGLGAVKRALLRFKPVGWLARFTVDLNTTTRQDLLTVWSATTADPVAGLDITAVKISAPSGNVTTARFGFGYDTNCTDVVTARAYPELTGSTVYTIARPKDGARRGVPGDVFGMKVALVQGASMTATVDLFGETLY